jgi:hypothetical protein
MSGPFHLPVDCSSLLLILPLQFDVYQDFLT